MSDNTELLSRIDALERRLLTLEAVWHKSSAIANGVDSIIARWPGPFTARQVHEALLAEHPELGNMIEHHKVEPKIHRMAKAGLLLVTFQGAGPHPTIYERNPNPPAAAGQPGAKRGARHDYESGFRAVVREALEVLPERFTLADLQAWVAEHKPALVVPEGSWSSTLRKLIDLEELVVVERGTRGRTLKKYSRTEKRVAPNGDELRSLELAWKEFRAANPVAKMPDYVPSLKREDIPPRILETSRE